MREGSTGSHVQSLQNSLKKLGYELQADGIFGPNTEAAVIKFQKDHFLVADGIVGPKTISRITDLNDPGYLKQKDLEDAANRLDVPVAAVMAINEVESRGQGFIDASKPAILFERHIMRRRLIMVGGFDVMALQTTSPDVVNRRPGGYQGGIKEHYRLEKAKKIHVESAIESTSWGLFQILGLHWERLGYQSAGDFATKMRTSEEHHLRALVRFIETDKDLLQALRQREWKRVAKIYNGPHYFKNSYDVKLQEAYERYSRLYPNANSKEQEVS